MSRPVVWIVSLELLILFVLLWPNSLDNVPMDFGIALVFGWISYLGRVVPEVRINWDGVVTALVCLALFGAGAHVFLRWFYQEASRVKDSVGRRWRWRWTGWLVNGIVLLFLAGLATAGIGHQVGWLITSSEPLVGTGGRRSHSVYNLKEIGLGLHNYHQALGSFPPGGTFDRQGRPLHSWQAMILPYIEPTYLNSEQKDLYDLIDFSISWDDLRNRSAFQTTVDAYCYRGIPVRKDAAGYALTSYAANARMLGGDVPRSLRDVPDGSSLTLMAGEVKSRFKPWGDPTNWRDPALGINRSPDGFGSPFPGGADFLFVDGSVRFIKDTIAPRILKALSTPRGGEQVSSDNF